METLEGRILFADFAVAGPTTFANAAFGSAVWGDYDADGFLDALVVGQTGSTDASRVGLVYKGNGTSTFTLAATLPIGVQNGAGAWGDIDNDGDLDFALVGNDSAGGLTTAVFRNDGSNTFTDVNATALVGAGAASLAWGDFNNDGRLDLVVAGMESGGGRATRLYQNDGAGVFTEVTATGLIGISSSAVAWGDFNNDGYLDLALSGDTADGVDATHVYSNDGGSGSFTEVATPDGAREGSVAWGDYDSDGDLDLLTSGYTSGTTAAATKLFNNDSGVFTAVSVTNLIGVGRGAAVWGDFNNDGILDVTVIGSAGNNDTSKTVRFFRGVGEGTFTQTQSFVGLTSASAAWGDYDNDGKLDALYTGKDGSNATALLRNTTTAAANTPPDAPTGLTATAESLTSVSLNWNVPSDTQQSTSAMSFAIRVGTTPGGSDIVNPMANTATGFRALPRIGSVLQTANGWTLTGLAAGTYYWSVQAIDSGLAGSAFAAEESFVAGPLPPTPSIASIGAVRVEGTAIAVSASATDPDSDLTTLSYAWQVFKDGGGTPVATGTGSDWSFTPDDDGSYRIVLTVSDQDDGSGSAEQTISVSNVAPTPSIVSIGSVRVVGTSIAVSGSATEPAGVNDTLSYAWEVYKDGATTPFATGGGTDWSFTPDDSGSYRIALTVSDEDSGSASAEQTIAVSDVAPVIDLEVQGTSADDVIRVLFAKNDTELKVVRNGVVIDRVPVDAITGRIVVQGEDGNDDIRVAPRVTVHADLYGGAGNDTLRGGRGNDRLFGEDGNDVLHGHRGNDIFVGGAGDDRLSGGAGNDILIGGTNSDRLVGGSESDLLVSGSTNFDVDQTALTNMINEWTSASSYADRIGHLTGATGGLNDTTFLSQATVQNDGVQNELRGRSEIDWFAVSSLDKVFVQKKEQALAV